MTSVKIAIIICSTVIVAGIIGAYVFLSASGRTTDNYTAFLTVQLPTMLIAFGAVYQSWKNGKQLETAKAQLATVVKQTNGPVAAIAAQVTDIHAATVQNGNGATNG